LNIPETLGQIPHKTRFQWEAIFSPFVIANPFLKLSDEFSGSELATMRGIRAAVWGGMGLIGLLIYRRLKK